MPAGSLDVVYETRAVTVAAWQQVTIIAVREAICMAAVCAYVELTNRLASKQPNCVLSVIGERTKLPDPAVVRAGAAATRNTRAVCRARVVPGQGLWATAFKGMMREAGMSDPSSQQTFSSVDQATTWLAGAMSMDLRWRLQLTTLAGTLVYGSPSWSRPSQASRYLLDQHPVEGEVVPGKSKVDP